MTAIPVRDGERWHCQACIERQRREEDLAKFMEDLPAWTEKRARQAGMGPRELMATVDRIDVRIKKALPEDQVKSALAGVIPTKGWGIGSDGTGGGKTCACAAILLKCMRERAIEVVKSGKNPAEWLVWESWPGAVGWMRMNGTSDRFSAFVDRMCQARVLFLDDLGSERIKGSYVEDFAASQLDLVVDYRYREMLPTFYTTNMPLKGRSKDEPGLIEFYGARLASRLCGENPLCWVTGLADQRFQ